MIFSIIVPVKEINDYIRTAISHYLKMDFDDYELLIFPDYETNESFPELGDKIRFIPEAQREVDDFPSVNLIVRADLFKQIGGYDSNFFQVKIQSCVLTL